jgi:hypothetical protein
VLAQGQVDLAPQVVLELLAAHEADGVVGRAAALDLLAQLLVGPLLLLELGQRLLQVAADAGVVASLEPDAEQRPVAERDPHAHELAAPARQLQAVLGQHRRALGERRLVGGAQRGGGGRGQQLGVVAADHAVGAGAPEQHFGGAVDIAVAAASVLGVDGQPQRFERGAQGGRAGRGLDGQCHGFQVI